MKYIIAFIFSTNVYSASTFIKCSDFGKKDGYSFYSLSSSCGENCVEIPSDYSYEYHECSVNIVTVNQSKKSLYDSNKVMLDQEVFIKKVISANIEFGKNLVIDLNYKMTLKGLNTQQIIDLDTKMSKVKSLLESGSINTAKSLLDSMAVDSVFTQVDKDYFSAKVNAYLGN